MIIHAILKEPLVGVGDKKCIFWVHEIIEVQADQSCKQQSFLKRLQPKYESFLTLNKIKVFLSAFSWNDAVIFNINLSFT